MRAVIKFMFVGAFLLSWLAPLRAQAENKATKAIRTVMAEQSAAWNRGDIVGFMAGYWRSEETVFVSGDTVTKGWETVLARYQRNYDSRAKMGTLTFDELEINLLDKKTATVIGRWSLQREKDNPHGRFTLIFRKFKEGWRIIHDHTS